MNVGRIAAILFAMFYAGGLASNWDKVWDSSVGIGVCAAVLLGAVLVALAPWSVDD